MHRQPKSNRRFFICTALFVFGGAAGCLTCRLCSAEAHAAIMEAFIGRLQESAVWSALTWNLLVPVCVFFLAGSIYGFLLIPALNAGLGFLAGLLATAILSRYGVRLIWLAALCAAFAALIPYVICISAAGMRISQGIYLVWRSDGKRTFDIRREECVLLRGLCVLSLVSLVEAALVSWRISI